jgi:hypothetical protein
LLAQVPVEKPRGHPCKRRSRLSVCLIRQPGAFSWNAKSTVSRTTRLVPVPQKTMATALEAVIVPCTKPNISSKNDETNKLGIFKGDVDILMPYSQSNWQGSLAGSHLWHWIRAPICRSTAAFPRIVYGGGTWSLGTSLGHTSHATHVSRLLLKCALNAMHVPRRLVKCASNARVLPFVARPVPVSTLIGFRNARLAVFKRPAAKTSKCHWSQAVDAMRHRA